MNKMRKFLLQAMGIKLGIVILGVSIMGVGYITGKVWFNSSATQGEIKSAIEQAQLQDINTRNTFGLTGLMFAASYAKPEMAALLIKKGAALNLKSNDNIRNTALHIACYNGDYEGSYKVAELLLNANANTNIGNSQGQRPIHYILEIDNLDKRLVLMQQLAKTGADINVKNNEGNTMLHLAAEANQKLWIRKARKVFGDKLKIDIRNNAGQTPLDVAVVLGFVGSDSTAEVLGGEYY